MAQNDKPVHEIRLGKVKAAIWRNETESGTRYGVTFSRIYKTGEGWESSSSFGRDELPLLGKVADMAHTWIYQQKRFHASLNLSPFSLLAWVDDSATESMNR